MSKNDQFLSRSFVAANVPDVDRLYRGPYWHDCARCGQAVCRASTDVTRLFRAPSWRHCVPYGEAVHGTLLMWLCLMMLQGCVENPTDRARPDVARLCREPYWFDCTNIFRRTMVTWRMQRNRRDRTYNVGFAHFWNEYKSVWRQVRLNFLDML